MSSRSTTTTNYISASEIVLTRCLSFFGLLPSAATAQPNSKVVIASNSNKLLPLRSFYIYWQTAKFIPLILLAGVGVIYEVLSKIADLIHNTTLDGDIQVVHLVQYSQYWIKTFVVVLIFALFYAKSSSILDLIQQFDRAITPAIDDSSKNSVKGHHNHDGGTEKVNISKNVEGHHCGRTEKVTSTAVLITVVIYMAAVAGTRLYAASTSPERYELRAFLVGEISYMSAEFVMLFVRHFPEAVRFLCSAYLGVVLFRFSRSSAEECQEVLRRVIRGDNKADGGLSIRYLQAAWMARERALASTEKVQIRLGGLLAVILMADILCLNSCLANFLMPNDMQTWDDQVRNAVSIFCYLASSGSIAAGLIRLHDIVS